VSNQEALIIQKISGTIKKLEPTAEIFLFGSHARGSAHADSDWDILILLDTVKVSLKKEQELRHSLVNVEIESGEAISAFVYSKEVWQDKFEITPFYRNVMKDGIRIA
jgi:predicted nucleotidyltransferase